MHGALSFIGPSGAGKTELLCRLLPELRRLGLRPAVVKHTPHVHALHKPGSDTERFHQAGAVPVGFATPEGLALVLPPDEKALLHRVKRLAPEADLLLIEGGKHGPFPKIEVWRSALGPPLHLGVSGVLAVVTDEETTSFSLPRFGHHDVSALAQWIVRTLAPSRLSTAASPKQNDGVTVRPALRLTDGQAVWSEDAVAREEPLEIRLAGDPIAVTMRTPGEDRLLTLGFLFAEGIIRSVDDVSATFHCGRPGEPGYGNVMEVVAAPGARLELRRTPSSARGTLTTSACGVCGRQSIDDLVALCRPVPLGPRIPYEWVTQAPERLAETQIHFAQSGGVHAAAVLSATGQRLAAFEDVGRHNAVDKAIGALVQTRHLLSRAFPTQALPGLSPEDTPAVLMVSGRASFEILQKASVAGIPIVASVSAASALAVDLAERMGITLATFVRPGRLNVYTHGERLVGLP